MIAKSYRTAKGTELPLLNLRGKQYLEVKFRLVWFREDHPDWSIETELVSVTDVSAYARAIVKDETGRIIATSHKYESIQGFPDFIEKAETGAIGRALALIGYGTQFCADELDEGQRIVDAPATIPSRGRSRDQALIHEHNVVDVKNEFRKAEEKERQFQQRGEASPGTEEDSVEEENASPSLEPGDYKISFGRKYKGKRLKEIPRNELESYLQWLEASAERQGTPISYQVKLLKDAFDRFYPATEEAAHH